MHPQSRPQWFQRLVYATAFVSTSALLGLPAIAAVPNHSARIAKPELAQAFPETQPATPDPGGLTNPTTPTETQPSLPAPVEAAPSTPAPVESTPAAPVEPQTTPQNENRTSKHCDYPYTGVGLLGSPSPANGTRGPLVIPRDCKPST
jgi:hypothetical protein